MAESENLLSSLWTKIRDRLNASSVFSRVPAIQALKRFTGDPDAELQEALGAAGRAGLAVAITEPMLEVVDSQTGRGRIRFSVLIAEAPELNRGSGGTGRPGPVVMDSAIASLHLWTGHDLPIGPVIFSGAPVVPEETGGTIRTLNFICGVMVAAAD